MYTKLRPHYCINPKTTEIQEKQHSGTVDTVKILRSTEAVAKELMRDNEVANEDTKVIMRATEVVAEDTGVIRCY